jgi:hypothetical protein
MVKGATMGHASTSVTRGHRFNAGGAFVGAGILALSFVAVPPDIDVARTETRAVQRTALALSPPALSPPALLGALEKLVSNQVHAVVPVTSMAAGGAAKTPAAGVTTRLAAVPAIAPAQVNPTALAATTNAIDWSPILAPLLGIVGLPLLVGAILFGFLVAIPAEAAIQNSYDFIRSLFGLPPQELPLPGTVGALPKTAAARANTNVTAASTLRNRPGLNNFAGATETTLGPAEGSPVVAKSPVTAKRKAATSRTGTSTKDVTETVKADDESTGSTAAATPKLSAGAPTSGRVEPTARPATPRSGVRDSRGVGRQLREQSHPSNRGHSATRTGSSSAAASSAGSSSAGGQPGGS